MKVHEDSTYEISKTRLPVRRPDMVRFFTRRSTRHLELITFASDSNVTVCVWVCVFVFRYIGQEKVKMCSMRVQQLKKKKKKKKKQWTRLNSFANPLNTESRLMSSIEARSIDSRAIIHMSQQTAYIIMENTYTKMMEYHRNNQIDWLWFNEIQWHHPFEYNDKWYLNRIFSNRSNRSIQNFNPLLLLFIILNIIIIWWTFLM